MTVKTFYSNTYVLDTQVRYTLHGPSGEWHRTIGRKQAADILTDPELPVGWTVTRDLITTSVKACPWCGARPLQYEMDCDGWASTGTCGSEQCAQLKRCDGCGGDGIRRWSSWRGDLCDPCHTVADERGLITLPGEYGLFPFSEGAHLYA